MPPRITSACAADIPSEASAATAKQMSFTIGPPLWGNAADGRSADRWNHSARFLSAARHAQIYFLNSFLPALVRRPDRVVTTHADLPKLGLDREHLHDRLRRQAGIVRPV